MANETDSDMRGDRADVVIIDELADSPKLGEPNPAELMIARFSHAQDPAILEGGNADMLGRAVRHLLDRIVELEADGERLRKRAAEQLERLERGGHG